MNLEIPEDHRLRRDRLRRLIQSGEHTFYKLGKLLAEEINGRTRAQRMIEGERFEIGAIDHNGLQFALRPGFILSLDTIDDWGCPYCGSAHGSGVHPSRWPGEAQLASNKFYYSPTTGDLFTISRTCWGSVPRSVIEHCFIEPGSAPVVAASSHTAEQMTVASATGRRIGALLGGIVAGLRELCGKPKSS